MVFKNGQRHYPFQSPLIIKAFAFHLQRIKKSIAMDEELIPEGALPHGALLLSCLSVRSAPFSLQHSSGNLLYRFSEL